MCSVFHPRLGESLEVGVPCRLKNTTRSCLSQELQNRNTDDDDDVDDDDEDDDNVDDADG